METFVKTQLSMIDCGLIAMPAENIRKRAITWGISRKFGKNNTQRCDHSGMKSYVEASKLGICGFPDALDLIDVAITAMLNGTLDHSPYAKFMILLAASEYIEEQFGRNARIEGISNGSVTILAEVEIKNPIVIMCRPSMAFIPNSNRRMLQIDCNHIEAVGWWKSE